MTYPNTMAGAARSVAELQPDILTVHAAAGEAGIGAVAEALPHARVAAVTVLTSLGALDLAELGISGTPEQVVMRWARVAVAAGARAIVSSGAGGFTLRALLGDEPLLITPASAWRGPSAPTSSGSSPRGRDHGRCRPARCGSPGDGRRRPTGCGACHCGRSGGGARRCSVGRRRATPSLSSEQRSAASAKAVANRRRRAEVKAIYEADTCPGTTSSRWPTSTGRCRPACAGRRCCACQESVRSGCTGS